MCNTIIMIYLTVNVHSHSIIWITFRTVMKWNHPCCLIYCCKYFPIFNLRKTLLQYQLNYKEKELTILRTYSSASLLPDRCTLLATSVKDRVRNVYNKNKWQFAVTRHELNNTFVNLRIFFLFIEATTCLTSPMLVSYNISSMKDLTRNKPLWSTYSSKYISVLCNNPL